MENYFTTESYHLPEKHALILHGDTSEYLIDYYLNFKDNQIVLRPGHDEELKRLLACLGIHITLRGPEESIAWTIHMRAEVPYTLFATGNSSDSFLIGQALYENIRHTDMSIFHSQVSKKQGVSSKSIVKCETNDICKLVEAFYEQSEQLSLKISCSDTSDDIYALVSMPGFDESWFNSITPQEAYAELENIPHKLMKQCKFRFFCDCSADKLLPYLSSIERTTLEELFGEDTQLLVTCPRCGKNFTVSREEVEKQRN